MAMADRVIVDPYTVVAFHHTAAFALDITAERLNLPETASLRQASERERQAYRNAGRDDEMLDRIAMAVEPTCVGRRTVNGRDELIIDYRWQWYMPDRAAAEIIYGDRLSGSWLDDEDMAVSIFRLSLDRPNARIRFGDLPDGPVDIASVARALPTCPTGN